MATPSRPTYRSHPRVVAASIEIRTRMSGGNFLSAYLVTTYGVEFMRRTGGSIVNISSTAGRDGSYGLYSAMKAGLEGLTRSMAMDYAPLGIRVNAVSPGWINTPANAPEPDSPAQIKWETTASLLRRMGNVDEIAMPVLFLASDHASFITGATLVVDGGLWLTASRHAFATPEAIGH